MKFKNLNKNKMRKERGITLVALVITIIVLVILASITIGALEEEGILSKTKETEKEVEISKEKDMLSIAIVGAIKNSSLGEIEVGILEKELEENIGEGKFDLKEIKDKFIVTFTDSEREYLIDKEGNIEEYSGAVIIEVVEKSTNNIKINVTAISKEGMAENAEYKYYIKKTTEKDYPDEASYIGEDTIYDFTGLEENTSYTIKVETRDKAGNVLEAEQTEKTMKTLLGDVTFGTPVWSGGRASVTINTDSDYVIRYQINSTTGTWTTITNGGEVKNLKDGDKVYAKLQYGTNDGDYKGIIIQDLIGPTVNVATSSETTRSITANVTSADNESGMPANPTYSYYIKKSSASSYPSQAEYTGTATSYKFDGLDQTTSYDIKVTTVDSAGNEGTGETLNNKTGTVPSGLQTGVITFGTPQWSGGLANITIKTSKTNYTIEYQINGKDGTWKPIENLGTVTGLNHNDTVYARLTDGKNAGDYASVTIIDGINPIISSFKVTGTTATTATVQTSATDNESGIESYIYEYKKPGETTYTKAETTSSTTYTYTNLEEGVVYYLRVTAQDKGGNKVSTEEFSGKGIFAILYSDGDLRFNIRGTINEEKIARGATVVLQSKDVSNLNTINNSEQRPWNLNVTSIKTVTFEEKIEPSYIAHWFEGCTNLATINNISNLVTDNITNMQYMFRNCSKLGSIDLSAFNTTKVTNMQRMFDGCSSIKNLDLSSFDTYKVTSMHYMFNGMTNVETLNISNFNTSQVKNMGRMFFSCQKLESLDLTSFNTSNVTGMGEMFGSCTNLKEVKWTNIDAQKVTSTYQMFNECNNLENIIFNEFKTSNISNMTGMFRRCYKLSNIDLSGFNTSNATSMKSMFQECRGLTNLDLTTFNTSNVKSMEYMFHECKNLKEIKWTDIDAQKVTTMHFMFSQCTNLETVDFSKLKTRDATHMDHMFAGCYKLSNIDLSGFSTNNVENMASMFVECRSLTSLDVTKFNTANVIDMQYMFAHCVGLTSLNLGNNFSTSRVENMEQMFVNCDRLTSLDLSKFDTSNVTNMKHMFYSCNNIQNLNISNFNTSKVTSMNSMFLNCDKLLTLDMRTATFDTVTDYTYCFSDVNENVKIIVKDDAEKAWVQDKLYKGTVVKVSEL